MGHDNNSTISGASQLRDIVEGRFGHLLRSQLARWNPDRDSGQIDDALQAACDLFIRKGNHRTSAPEVFVWLRTTAHRQLAHDRRNGQREVLMDPLAASFDLSIAQSPPPETELIEREVAHDRARLLKEIVSRLSERQRLVLALHVRGEKRPRIATRLGISPRVVRRELEVILSIARAAVAQLAGGGCEDGETLVTRRAYGLATPVEAAQARRHLASCSRCTDFSRRLDLWREGAAAALPMPTVVERTHPGRLADIAASLRQHVMDGGAQLKQHAISAYYRLADPTPLVGVRPGAATAIIAGCVLGTGTYAYCVDSVNPLAAVPGLVEHRHKRRPAAQPKAHKRARAAQQPIAANPTPTPTPPPAATTTTPTTSTTQPSSQTQPATPPPSPPPPEQSFEPASPTYASSSQPHKSASSKPAPVANDGVPEFGGP